MCHRKTTVAPVQDRRVRFFAVRTLGSRAAPLHDHSRWERPPPLGAHFRDLGRRGDKTLFKARERRPGCARCLAGRASPRLPADTWLLAVGEMGRRGCPPPPRR
ncbi:hypothetical protein AAFF_G00332820 [Aldrovandia affinis]|uniref:Uncharacterized protein n=1 Tax=Aldrovandia affinis TaxID=143900 RepID=A0AAD7WQ50_9TELE|nr:hypothetical protein AAFF_G00332820 [Aldrovandia affinis]